MDENGNIPSASGAEPQQPAPEPAPSAVPENPFAAFGAPGPGSQPAPAAPSDAVQPAPAAAAPAPEIAQHAPTAPTQPYYDATAAQAAQQPYAPYGQSAGAGQSYAYTQATAQQPTYAPYDGAGYGSYGAGSQPPVPPAPAQNIYPGYDPPNPNQKRRWPWFLLGLAVGLVVGMGGCASCVGIMALADYDSSYDSYNSFEADGISQGEPGEGDVCTKGFYTVGPAGQIPAGLYYLEGSNEKLSHYYVFDGDDGRYSVDDSVQYFGNYFVDLDEGDLIVFDPGDEATMYPAPSTSTDPTAPYTNGCYRVGIDIPAGSYTITAATVGEGETDEDSAAFVMKNLDFDDDSIVDTKYVIPGGEQTVTVSNGQYLELFAATATPVAQG